MNVHVQSIINQTSPLAGSISTPAAQTTQVSTPFQVAEKIGSQILHEVNSAFTSESAQENHIETNPTDVKQELTHLALQKARSPQEAAQFQAGIDELFQTFQETKTPSKSALSRLVQTGADLGITRETAHKAIATIKNWKNLSSKDRLFSAGSIGIDVLENLHVLSKEEASEYRGVATAVSLLGNSQVSSREKALAAAHALSALTTTSFTGLLDMPESIGGVPVIGSATAKDGSAGYLLADGRITSKSDLRTSANVSSALQAITVLTGEGTTEDKLVALTAVGLNAARANELINDVDVGRVGAALSVFHTVNNWDEMNDAQRLTATIQTADSVISALSGSSTSQAGTSSLASMGRRILGGAASLIGVVMGVDQAVDVVDSLRKMPRSDAMKAGALGLGMAGASIGAGVSVASAMAAGATIGTTAFPVVGTLIGGAIGAMAGLAIGAFGSKKSKGLIARNAWRDAAEQGGFAFKVNDSHHVQLADGSTYNIGKDGKHRLPNLNGTTRHVSEVDLGHPLWEHGFADAQLFAIATGVDPVTHQDYQLFDRAAAFGFNAATSNASSYEGMRANFRTMIEKSGLKTEQLALRLEVLRVSNKISESEYRIYLARMNQIWGTTLQPTDRASTHQAFVQQLARHPELGKEEEKLLLFLTERKHYLESVESLLERLPGQQRKEASEAALAL